ncbi:MAG: 50S ribosomal protein L15 [Candidatus Omnitrophica bacterium]|nr:50S ribosomal protein L15 [Candidatus Omnitrophota bacterium]
MTLRIDNLRRPKGHRRKKKILGRGIGSGKGHTAGKGHKGALARSGGGSFTPGFEGGQMPLIRRIPKRGFTNIFKKEWTIVNIGQIETRAIEAGVIVDKDFLLKYEVIKKKDNPLKVLGKGVLTKSVTVKADAFSASAEKAIIKAGGKAEWLGPRPVPEVPKPKVVPAPPKKQEDAPKEKPAKDAAPKEKAAKDVSQKEKPAKDASQQQKEKPAKNNTPKDKKSE